METQKKKLSEKPTLTRLLANEMRVIKGGDEAEAEAKKNAAEQAGKQ